MSNPTPYDLLPPTVIIGVLTAGWGVLLYWLLTLNEDDNFPPGAP